MRIGNKLRIYSEQLRTMAQGTEDNRDDRKRKRQRASKRKRNIEEYVMRNKKDFRDTQTKHF